MNRGEASVPPRRLFVHSLSFLRERQIRSLLAAFGYRVTTGWPRKSDLVGVWGQRPTARRGHWIAKRSGSEILTIEDGFLRSLRPGRAEAPLSLVLDDIGIYFDASRSSRLERILLDGPNEENWMMRARDGIDLLRETRLSKYTPLVSRIDFEPGYVLIVDQTRGDASIAGALADTTDFGNALKAARLENPGSRLLVKTHPEVSMGRKAGHYCADDLRDGEELLSDLVNPWDLIEHASSVYVVSSQMGYEAVLAGKPVRTFGAAFYAGWGLTEDEKTVSRRSAKLSREALFHGCHIEYPFYFDPYTQGQGDFETVVEALAARRDAAMPMDDRAGDVFGGIRLWKRSNVAAFRRQQPVPPRFVKSPERALKIAERTGRHAWVWPSRAPEMLDLPSGRTGFVEDGFIRSVGLGADLTYAASLVFDKTGIYFDPNGPSDLEEWIKCAATGHADESRAKALRRQITEAGITKYNVGAQIDIDVPSGRPVIVVPGQVEDDLSIVRGCPTISTNQALLQAARSENPDAYVIYKPHPDVEAGLRKGAIPEQVLRENADFVASYGSADHLLDLSQEVWTLTSLMGFEAMLRDKRVTCLGQPFYAGWGLTSDLAPSIGRRTARPNLDQLVWATLIAYPKYIDPITGHPCTPERVVERLSAGAPTRKSGTLSRLQGLFASQSWLWRR